MRQSALQPASTPGTDRSRMRVRLAKLEPKIRKPPFELFEQPFTIGKPADEKCELIVMNQELRSRIPEYTHRVGGETVLEVIPDGVHGRLNRRFEEPGNFCAVCGNASPSIRQ